MRRRLSWWSPLDVSETAGKSEASLLYREVNAQ